MNFDDFDKIVAIRFGNSILFGRPALEKMNQEEDYDQLISLAELKLMSALDLGEKWEDAAKNPKILFIVPENTELKERIRRPLSTFIY